MKINENSIDEISEAVINLMNDHAELNDSFNVYEFHTDFNDFILEVKQLYKSKMFLKKQMEILKKYTPSSEPLLYDKMIHMEGEPVYDTSTRCWVIIQSCDDAGITFNDGTQITRSNTINNRYYDKWQDFTEDEKARQKSIKAQELFETESFNILESQIKDDEKKRILTKLKNLLLVQDLVEENKRSAIDYIDLCIEILSKEQKGETDNVQ